MKTNLKKRHIAAAVALAALTACVAPHKTPRTAPNPPAAVQHVGPAYLYPDVTLTPGLADTLNAEDLTRSYNGKTYSQAHRNVPESEKQQVLTEYHFTIKPKTGTVEIDHFYPLCAGGSNDIKNLWPQPAVNAWNGNDFGFHAKDKLEAYTCVEIKAGRLDPQDAFQRMTTDWVKFYLDLGLDKKLGSASQTVE